MSLTKHCIFGHTTNDLRDIMAENSPLCINGFDQFHLFVPQIFHVNINVNTVMFFNI